MGKGWIKVGGGKERKGISEWGDCRILAHQNQSSYGERYREISSLWEILRSRKAPRPKPRPPPRRSARMGSQNGAHDDAACLSRFHCSIYTLRVFFFSSCFTLCCTCAIPQCLQDRLCMRCLLGGRRRRALQPCLWSAEGGKGRGGLGAFVLSSRSGWTSPCALSARAR